MCSLRRTRCGRARAREGPADEGPAGPFRGELYSVGSSGLGAGKGSGSKSSQPTGIVNTLPSATVISSVSILLGLIPATSKVSGDIIDSNENFAAENSILSIV